MENKVTKRQKFNAIHDYFLDHEDAVLTVPVEDGKLTLAASEIAAFAEAEIALLDKKAVKAKENASKKKETVDALLDVVAEALGEDYEPIADIAARIEGEDVTVSKVTYRLNKLVETGVAEKQAIKVPGSDGKKNRSIQGFRRKV